MSDLLKDTIAERRLDFKAGDGSDVSLRVRLARPEVDPEGGGSWRCAIEVSGTSVSRGVRWVSGEDSYQALVMAMELVQVDIELEMRQRSLSRAQGELDLGLLPRHL